MTRPLPPLDLRPLGEFRAAPDLRDWVKATFIIDEGQDIDPINSDYYHAGRASLGGHKETP